LVTRLSNSHNHKQTNINHYRLSCGSISEEHRKRKIKDGWMKERNCAINVRNNRGIQQTQEDRIKKTTECRVYLKRKKTYLNMRKGGV
jgi:hypothetical protein